MSQQLELVVSLILLLIMAICLVTLIRVIGRAWDRSEEDQFLSLPEKRSSIIKRLCGKRAFILLTLSLLCVFLYQLTPTADGFAPSPSLVDRVEGSVLLYQVLSRIGTLAVVLNIHLLTLLFMLPCILLKSYRTIATSLCPVFSFLVVVKGRQLLVDFLRGDSTNLLIYEIQIYLKPRFANPANANLAPGFSVINETAFHGFIYISMILTFILFVEWKYLMKRADR